VEEPTAWTRRVFPGEIRARSANRSAGTFPLVCELHSALPGDLSMFGAERHAARGAGENHDRAVVPATAYQVFLVRVVDGEGVHVLYASLTTQTMNSTDSARIMNPTKHRQARKSQSRFMGLTIRVMPRELNQITPGNLL